MKSKCDLSFEPFKSAGLKYNNDIGKKACKLLVVEETAKAWFQWET